MPFASPARPSGPKPAERSPAAKSTGTGSKPKGPRRVGKTKCVFVCVCVCVGGGGCLRAPIAAHPSDAMMLPFVGFQARKRKDP